MNIGIIGCGNMGAALVENLAKRGDASRIRIFDKETPRQESLAKGFGVSAESSLEALVASSDTIIIAVKPQDIDPVLASLTGAQGKLVISIAAGMTLVYLESKMGRVAIVRAMPNINAMIGKSLTTLCANARVSKVQRQEAEDIFKAVGDVIFVTEDLMNPATAIAGSGPAFVAYLLKDLGALSIEDVMRRAAVAFRFSPADALTMARATVAGTARILEVNFDKEILIKKVCSKGGTTEAGMKVLESRGKTEAALEAAIQAACRRAGELAKH
jgi:pyrroline-5-carboxylate reductase